MLPTRKDGFYRKSRNLFKIKLVVQLKNAFHNKEEFSKESVFSFFLSVVSVLIQTLVVLWHFDNGRDLVLPISIFQQCQIFLSKQTNKKFSWLNVNCFGIFISRKKYLHKHCPEYFLSKTYQRYLLLLKVFDSLCSCVTWLNISPLCFKYL